MSNRLTVMMRPMSNKLELSSLLGATRNAVLGWGDRIVPKQGTSHEGPLQFSAQFGKVLPHQREESEQFRMEHGWSRVEIDQIVTWLQATVDALREDAANLQANPMEVVTPSDPWGDTTESLVVVGDVDLLRQADRVESLISKWLEA